MLRKQTLADCLADLLDITYRTKRFESLIYKLNVRDLKYLIAQIEEYQAKKLDIHKRDKGELDANKN